MQFYELAVKKACIQLHRLACMHIKFHISLSEQLTRISQCLFYIQVGSRGGVNNLACSCKKSLRANGAIFNEGKQWLCAVKEVVSFLYPFFRLSDIKQRYAETLMWLRNVPVMFSTRPKTLTFWVEFFCMIEMLEIGLAIGYYYVYTLILTLEIVVEKKVVCRF